MTFRAAAKWLLYVVAAALAAAIAGIAIVWWRLPSYAEEIKSWAHTQTGFYVRFQALTPTLRWYGPELFFSQPELRSRDNTRILVRARGLRVGFNPFIILWTGKIHPGRVRIDAPELSLTRIAPNRFRLGSDIEFGGTQSDPRLRLLSLPRGRLRVRGALVQIEQWNAALPHLQFRALDIDARRALNAFELKAAAKLPASLGGGASVAFVARDLPTQAPLQWEANVRVRDASLPGWQRAAPVDMAQASAGTAQVNLKVRARGLDSMAGVLNVDANRLGWSASARADLQHALTDFGGRFEFSRVGDAWHVNTQKLRAFVGHRPTRDSRVALDITYAKDQVRRVSLSADYLPLENMSALAQLAPPSSARDRGLQLALTGEWFDARFGYVRNDTANRTRWNIAGRFTGFGAAPAEKFPGWRGIDGDIRGNESGGRLKIAAAKNGAQIDWPYQWLEAAPLDSLHASIFWKASPVELLIASQDLEASNRDLRIQAKFSWTQFKEDRSPELVLAAALLDAKTTIARKYLPRRNIAPAAMAWLDRAFVAGTVARGDVIFRGPVRSFPFRDGSGLFLARIPVSGLTLDYQPGWPRLDDGDLDAEFQNAGAAIHMHRARLRDWEVQDATASFPDLAAGELTVHAHSRPDAAAVLDYLAATPLNDLTGGAFSLARASGPVDADLTLFFPFKHFDQRRVLVKSQLDGVSVSYKDTKLAATDLRGSLEMDGPQVAAAQIQGTAFGGPVQLRARQPHSRADTTTQFDLRGSLTAEALRDLLGLPDNVLGQGRTEWRGVVRLAPEPARERTVHVTSSLAGIEIKLPHPLAKPAAQGMSSYANFDWPRSGGLIVHAGIAPVARAVAELDLSGEQMRIARASIVFGAGTPELIDEPGISLAGRIERFDLTGWVAGGAKPAGPAAGAPGTSADEMLNGGEVQFGRLLIHGFEFRDLTLILSKDADHWHVAADGPETHGTVSLPRKADASPWELKFSELSAGLASEDTPNSPKLADDKVLAEPHSIPATNLHIDSFKWRDRVLGAVGAQLMKVEDGLVLDHFTIDSADFAFRSQGSWRGLKAGQCRLDGALRASDVQATLARFGYADVIQAKSGVLAFNLNWLGPPALDAVKGLNGRIELDSEKGQIMALHPGAGRVLGLASVATLPRRLALDFSDLTDKGLAFDTLRADFDVRNGDAFTDNALLKGPAAEIGLVGRVGLAKHDFDQTAVVTGSLGNSLPLAALAAGPVVGAAVLLFSQVFKQPLKGLARGYYRVTGTWDNPVVERIKGDEAAAAKKEELDVSGGSK